METKNNIYDFLDYIKKDNLKYSSSFLTYSIRIYGSPYILDTNDNKHCYQSKINRYTSISNIINQIELSNTTA